MISPIAILLCLLLILASQIPLVEAQSGPAQQSGTGTGKGSGSNSATKCGSTCTTVILSCILGSCGVFTIAVILAILISKRRQRNKQHHKLQLWLNHDTGSGPLTDITIAETARQSASTSTSTSASSSASSQSFRPCSGVWKGTYHGTSTSLRNYGDHDMSVNLQFNVTDHTVLGTDGHDDRGAFQLHGSYRDPSHRIGVIKSYKYTTFMFTRRDHMRPLYLGTLTDDKHIQGTWELPNGDTGTFHLAYGDHDHNNAADTAPG